MRVTLLDPPSTTSDDGPVTKAGGRLSNFVPSSSRAEFTVVSFNAHSGVDGWGRAFDMVGCCKNFDADVVVLQESWRAEGRRSMAEEIGSELGYEVFEFETAKGRLSGPHPHPGPGWKPRSRRLDGPRVLLPDRTRAARKIVDDATSPADGRWPHGTASERGAWSVAVLSRLPVVHSEVIDLGQLRFDPTRRGAVRIDVTTSGQTVAVIGTHMAHFSRGVAAHYWKLRRLLEPITLPAVLAGDMNLWGPPVVAQMWGWRRAVKGRTWPSWFPHSQPDHILIRGGLVSVESAALPGCGSDHLPVMARLRAYG